MNHASLHQSLKAQQEFYARVFAPPSPEEVHAAKRETLRGIYSKLTELEAKLRTIEETEFGHYHKFNPNHDDLGRFTFGSGGGDGGSGGGANSDLGDLHVSAGLDNPPTQLGQGTDMAAGDGMPGDPARQNKQVRDVANKLGLDKDQRRALHYRVSGQDLDYHGVMNEAIDMLNE